MRLVKRICLLGLLFVPSTPATGADRDGNFYARVRANDAPIGGRFTVYAYMLDSLDAGVALPGPGRVLAINFRQSNGKDSFVIPGDLYLEGARKQRWKQGFLPLGDGRLAGLLPKNESRWALWWVPTDSEELVWESLVELSFHYGFAKSPFVPLSKEDTEATLKALPWEWIEGAVVDTDRPVAALAVPPNPASFDKVPVAKERRAPVYPRSSRMYAFEGTVHVVAVVNEKGTVLDTFVLHSDATHELNVSALSAVKSWIFKPGTKGGARVTGEVVIPVRFSLGSVK
jgi:TonB family protein